MFADDVWMEMDCNQQFHSMYFICERPLWIRESQENLVLQRQNNSCLLHYYYDQQTCFKITSGIQHAHYKGNQEYSYLQELLAWGRGSNTRHTCVIRHGDGGRCFCLRNYGFAHFTHMQFILKIRCDCAYPFCSIITRVPWQYVSHCRISLDFICADLTCVLSKYKCDGKADCLDASDEAHCDEEWVKHVDKAPERYKYHYRLIPFASGDNMGCKNIRMTLHMLCDGLIDCQDGRDELSCHYSSTDMALTEVGINMIKVKGRECPEGWSRCTAYHSYLCYPTWKRCIYERRLQFSLYCPRSEHLQYCTQFQCPAMFKVCRC